MTTERTTSFEADPADPEPSAARPGCCTGCGRSWEPEPAPDPLESELRMLGWLAEMGMQLTEIKLSRARRLLESDDPKDGARDRSELEFSHLSRSIRLSIALKNKLRNERAERAKEAAAQEEADQQERKKRLRKQVERMVGQAIENQAQQALERLKEADAEADEQPVSDRREALYENLSERVEEDDFERDLLRCPTGELAKRVCQDLGIEAAWDLWRNSHWAREEEARAKAAGAPCAAAPVAEAAGSEPVAAKPAEARPEAPAALPLRQLYPGQALPEVLQPAERERLEPQNLTSARYHRRE